jgi:hypothetical protein
MKYGKDSVNIDFYFYRASNGYLYHILSGKMESYGLGDNPVRWINNWLKSLHNVILIDRSTSCVQSGFSIS